MLRDFADYFIRRTVHGSFDSLSNCRMSAYIAQNYRCYVTKRLLKPYNRELHHRIPRSSGGEDTPANTIILDKDIHAIIHSRDIPFIEQLLSKLNISHSELSLLNQLRVEANNFPLDY